MFITQFLLEAVDQCFIWFSYKKKCFIWLHHDLRLGNGRSIEFRFRFNRISKFWVYEIQPHSNIIKVRFGFSLGLVGFASSLVTFQKTVEANIISDFRS